jgi:hypothetical protein
VPPERAPDVEANDRALRSTGRSSLRRKRERGSFDRTTAEEILDEGIVCHVGFSDGGNTFVVPMAYARIDDTLYLHGASANRTLRAVAAGAQICAAVTLLDALVLARSAFHHSVNYRSVTLFGTGRRVTDPAEGLAASVALLEHIAPGRSRDARLPTPAELVATLIVAVRIDEGSVKIRTGDPIDDAEDLDLGIRAGIIPLETVAGRGQPAADLDGSVTLPPYAERPQRRR